MYVIMLAVLWKEAIYMGYVISLITITIWVSVHHRRKRQGEAVLALYQHEDTRAAPQGSGANF